MTRRVSVTPSATPLGDWVPPTTWRVSVTPPGLQGSDAMTIRHVSVTLPVTLLGGWAPYTTWCVSVTRQGPDAGTARKVSIIQTLALGSGNGVGFVQYGYSDLAKG